MIYRIGLPRVDDPLGEFDSDTTEREDVYRPKDISVSPPCSCMGCIPMINFSMNMAIALVFSRL